MIDPDKFVISRRRKKYKFAHFKNLANCFEAQEWKKPVDKTPIVIELGAGTGYFSVELAKRHPDLQYVAIDVKADRLQAGARRAIEENIQNISFVRAHAQQLDDLFSPASISQIWLTFSDPFPKKRHSKHRLTHPHFLAIYENLLVSHGQLSIKTDNQPFFDWGLEQIVARKWNIDSLTYDLHESNFNDDYKIVTTFEQRFIKESLPIYAASFSR